MAGFTSYDDLISKITQSGQASTFDWFKALTPQGAGVWYTLWTSGGVPGAGTNPAGTPGTTYTQASGGIYFPNRSPQQKHLLTFGAVSSNAGTVMLYDRLAGVGALTMSPNAAKTVNSQALPRYADGAGVQVWAEVTTATAGASNGTISLTSYTNQDGTAGRVGGAIGLPFAASNQGTLVGPLPLQAGDTGVRSVQTVTTGVSTAGAFNIVLIRPIVYLPIQTAAWQEKDLVLQIASMPQILDGASLGMAYQAGSTAVTYLWGQLGIAWG